MTQESINPYPEPKGSFPSKEPIEPFEDSLNQLTPSPLEHVKEEILDFLYDLESDIKDLASLDQGKKKEWSEKFAEMRTKLFNFALGKEISYRLSLIESEFEKLKKHPYSALQQSILKEIQKLQVFLKT